MRLLLMHGPNLSQLGSRNPQVYGSATLDDIVAMVREEHPDLDVFTDDAEGALVQRLHAARSDGTAAVVINPGALTHYSYALQDALEMLECPIVEVHLSQTHARESFRRHSVVSPVATITITGAGTFGYRMAVHAVHHLLEGP